jgi:hypothetical protein
MQPLHKIYVSITFLNFIIYFYIFNYIKKIQCDKSMTNRIQMMIPNHVKCNNYLIFIMWFLKLKNYMNFENLSNQSCIFSYNFQFQFDINFNTSMVKGIYQCWVGMHLISYIYGCLHTNVSWPRNLRWKSFLKWFQNIGPIFLKIKSLILFFWPYKILNYLIM